MSAGAVRASRWTVALLCIAAVTVFLPMWAPLVLAAWFAVLAEPLIGRVRFLGGRHRAAAALTVLMFLLLLIPIGVLVISMIGGVAELLHAVRESEGGLGALQALIDGAPQPGAAAPEPWSTERVVTIVRSYGERAYGVLSMVAGAATKAVIGVFVFGVGAYVMLAYGKQWRAWFLEHSPLPPHQLERYGAAFAETGRGLLVGVGLTAVAQAVVATITYVALGITRALVLGLVTFFAGLIPTIGTALVWVPVAAGLALSGRTGAAIILAVVGVVVISSIDNLLRPALARWGNLKLPMFVVMVAMFGGLALLGAWGLVLGPLLVRLAVEALEISRDDRLFRRSGPQPQPGPAE